MLAYIWWIPWVGKTTVISQLELINNGLGHIIIPYSLGIGYDLKIIKRSVKLRLKTWITCICCIERVVVFSFAIVKTYDHLLILHRLGDIMQKLGNWSFAHYLAAVGFPGSDCNIAMLIGFCYLDHLRGGCTKNNGIKCSAYIGHKLYFHVH